MTAEKFAERLEKTTLGSKPERLGLLQEILKFRDLYYTSAVRGFLDRCYHAAPFSPEELDVLRAIIRDANLIIEDEYDSQKLRKTIGILLADDSSKTLTKLNRVEVWANDAETVIAGLPETQRARWIALFEHCRSAPAKPTAKWSKSAASLIDQVGTGEFHTRVVKWFGDVRPSLAGFRLTPHSSGVITPMADENSTVLTGLVWAAAACRDEEMSAAIGDLALVSFRKIPVVGAVCMRLGNACVNALERLPGLAPVAHLSRIYLKVRYAKARELIFKALDAAAARAGMSRDELVELSTPTFGLDHSGALRETFGAFVAQLQLTESGRVQLQWMGPDGTPQKSVPAAVKEGHAEELKEFKSMLGEIEDMAAAQKGRLDAMFRRERQWKFKSWRELYLDHPLVAPLARRIIWNFETAEGRRTSAIFHSDRFVDSTGAIVAGLDEETTVRLWHPLREERNEVRRWRDWLFANEVTQPFKQAHREIYLLTDAERQTATYSNRFAAHILRQPQFAALCRERTWDYKVRGPFDSFKHPTLQLPEETLTVEFWIESNRATETTPGGIYSYITTDQVRFLHGETAVPLAEISPLIFSEVMRDVDLLVSVTSVGNDADWLDAQRRETERTAWHRFSFGDLTGTAQTRRELLEKLVPKLKIADRCSVDDKFLIVRGDLRTYKIHLGSGNTQMEPNDQYLCIVQDAMKPDPRIFLPFEGDRTLSIILSKAFLLAADRKITDPRIVSQINHGRE